MSSPRKYRGLTKEGKWVYGHCCQDENKHYIGEKVHDTHWPDCPVLAGFVEVLPETVGQFVTKDKNGDDVFGGDRVIAGREDPDFSHEGIVTYRPKFADYVIVKDEYDVDEGYGNFGIKSKDIELLEEQG